MAPPYACWPCPALSSLYAGGALTEYSCRPSRRRVVQVLGALGASVVLSKTAVLAAPALLYPIWSPWIQAGGCGCSLCEPLNPGRCGNVLRLISAAWLRILGHASTTPGLVGCTSSFLAWLAAPRHSWPGWMHHHVCACKGGMSVCGVCMYVALP